MSGGTDVLAMKEDDVSKLLAAGAHLGDPNIDFQMAQYVFKVKTDGIPIINIRKTWEKLLIAARVVAAIENPADVCVLSNKPFGQVSNRKMVLVGYSCLRWMLAILYHTIHFDRIDVHCTSFSM